MADLQSRTDHLQARLDELAAEHHVPGATLGIVLGDERLELATGVVNVNTGVETTTDTVFQIGSIGKIYTTTVIMQLVDEGRIQLDAPVSTYLPSLLLADTEATDTVTVRQLLNHTSGIDGDQFQDFGRGDECLERFVESMSSLTQVAPPGSFFSYCNAGWVLAGHLAEKVAGAGFDRVFQERLFTPLGLTKSTMLPEEAILHRVSVGHLVDRETKTPNVVPQWMLPRSLGPAGLICQPVGELLDFARMHLDGGRATDGAQVLSAESVAAMQQETVSLHDRYTLGPGWGLGWILFDWGQEKVIGHDGATLGQGAYLRLVPERRFAVALLTNSDGRAPLYRTLFDEIFQDLVGMGIPPLPEPTAEADGVDLSAYAGTYERLGVRMELEIVDGGLQLAIKGTGPLAAQRPDPPPMRLRPVDKVTFLAAGDDPAVQELPVVFFDFDDGRPRFVHFGARATPRVS
jgi:CubicO group peptidase (beta-lactamase class C family)